MSSSPSSPLPPQSTTTATSSSNIPHMIQTPLGEAIVLTERVDPHYSPTSAEIAEYAQVLGMDIKLDSDLLWIAEKGLKEPLPDSWKPCKIVGSDDIFFFNYTTGESSWAHPADVKYTALYEAEKKKRITTSNNNNSNGNGSNKSPSTTTTTTNNSNNTTTIPNPYATTKPPPIITNNNVMNPQQQLPTNHHNIHLHHEEDESTQGNKSSSPGSSPVVLSTTNNNNNNNTATLHYPKPNISSPNITTSHRIMPTSLLYNNSEMIKLQNQVEELRSALTKSKLETEQAWARASSLEASVGELEIRLRLEEEETSRLKSLLQLTRSDGERRRLALKNELDETTSRLIVCEDARDNAERRVRELLLEEGARIRKIERDMKHFASRFGAKQQGNRNRNNNNMESTLESTTRSSLYPKTTLNYNQQPSSLQQTASTTTTNIPKTRSSHPRTSYMKKTNDGTVYYTGHDELDEQQQQQTTMNTMNEDEYDDDDNNLHTNQVQNDTFARDDDQDDQPSNTTSNKTPSPPLATTMMNGNNNNYYGNKSTQQNILNNKKSKHNNGNNTNRLVNNNNHIDEDDDEDHDDDVE
jgi:hypothetical protein